MSDRRTPYSQQTIRSILKQVSKKKLSAQAAFRKLRHLSYETLSAARLDHHRIVRKNLPEVMYGSGKTIEQLEKITRAGLKNGHPFLITRLDEDSFKKLRKRFPKLSYSKEAHLVYRKPARLGVNRGGRRPNSKSWVAIVTAGTSDASVAEEAAITLETLGIPMRRFYDCGVAGLHRLLDQVREIEQADVVICVAGMEGTLPSVLAGLIPRPVVAVPTSVGYGSSFKGLTPLLAMLNSCSQGVAVVNIDSGFNAACFASLVLDQINKSDDRRDEKD